MAQVVMEQLCASLEVTIASKRPVGASPSRSRMSTKNALLLALRGVALAGGSIGAEEAACFRRVSHVSFQVVMPLANLERMILD